jgi:hypothetical protein
MPKNLYLLKRKRAAIYFIFFKIFTGDKAETLAVMERVFSLAVRDANL